MVCHRFCPQALAEALKVNKTLTNIDLRGNKIGTEGAKAWCLGRGSVAPGLIGIGSFANHRLVVPYMFFFDFG